MHGQAVDGVEQVVNRQMRLFVHRHLPMATAGRARTERAIADQCDADRAGRIIRILKRHTDRLVRARQQIAARIAYNEIDMVLCFGDPNQKTPDADITYISRLCDQNNVPFASNLATAEMLVLGLDRGDLDWRDIVNPKSKPFTA